MSHGGATMMRPTRIGGQIAPGCAAPSPRRPRRRLRRDSASRRSPSAAVERRARRVARVRRVREEDAASRRARLVLRGWRAARSRRASAYERVASDALRRSGAADDQRRSSAGDAQPKMSLTRSKNGFSPSSCRRRRASRCGSVCASSSSRCFCSLVSFFGTATRGDHVQIAVAAARDVRHALAAQLEARAGLRAGRDVQLLAAVERRHLDAPAERERREADRQLAVEVVLFAMEERVLLHVDDDVEVAGRAAGGAVLAFARGGAAAGRWRSRRESSP